MPRHNQPRLKTSPEARQKLLKKRQALAVLLTAGKKRTGLFSDLAKQLDVSESAITHWFYGRTSSRRIHSHVTKLVKTVMLLNRADQEAAQAALAEKEGKEEYERVEV